MSLEFNLILLHYSVIRSFNFYYSLIHYIIHLHKDLNRFSFYKSVTDGLSD